ncbi:MAG TPA: flagellar biosynthesis anti-sigma factor FlgM [Chthonomonadaceae bacterium]|nr:flagellar biosynthesis anti-sigma factor FlgM [Chthonomonadaceae bacterium]
MKISVEEVSRVLAVSPLERRGNRPADADLAGRDSEGIEAGRLLESVPTQEVQQIKKLVNKLPEVREDRVQALKAQIESGTYQVSGEDIADLIIRRTLADNTAI